MSYLDFYGLGSEPFRVTPDPDFLFLSPSHKEALGTFLYGVSKRTGILSIVGEVGVGKTTILRSYLQRIEPDEIKLIYVFNPNVTFQDLVRTICDELEVPAKSDQALDLVSQLHHALIAEYSKGRNVVLVVDEAQNVPYETLENLRMLSNLETNTDKLLQIVLIGQPELEQKLNEYRLRQLRQRIAVHSTILPLSDQESREYILSRLEKCIVHKNGPIFSPSAIRTVVKNSGGIPRVINILCDNALITGYGYQQKPIKESVIKEVIADFNGEKKVPILRWALPGVFLALAFIGIWILFRDPPQPFVANPDRKVSPTQMIRETPAPVKQKVIPTRSASVKEKPRIYPKQSTLAALPEKRPPPRIQESRKKANVPNNVRPLPVSEGVPELRGSTEARIESERSMKIQQLLQTSENLQKEQRAKDAAEVLTNDSLTTRPKENLTIKTPDSLQIPAIQGLDPPAPIGDSDDAKTKKTEEPIRESILRNDPNLQVPPRVLHSVKPKYPHTGYLKKLEGSVVVKVLVNEKGTVETVQIVRGIPGDRLFSESAAAAVKKWKFVPGKTNGIPSKMWMRYTIRFRYHNS